MHQMDGVPPPHLQAFVSKPPRTRGSTAGASRRVCGCSGDDLQIRGYHIVILGKRHVYSMDEQLFTQIRNPFNLFIKLEILLLLSSPLQASSFQT
jgi:hypothetical protein